MSTQQNTENYSFYTINGQKPIQIPKRDLVTWGDLINKLERPTGFQSEKIEIAVNFKKRYYTPETKLAEISLQNDDKLLALLMPYSEDQPQYEEYVKQVKKQQEKCMAELKEENTVILSDAEGVRLTSFIQSNPKYIKLKEKLSKTYEQVETMIAIEECQGKQKEAIQFLESGKAKEHLHKIMKQVQRRWLEEFLEKKEMVEIKKYILDNKVGEDGYRSIIQELYKNHPKFKKFQPKHQAYVQKILLGRVIDSDDESEKEAGSQHHNSDSNSDSDSEKDDNQLQFNKELKKILDQIKQEKQQAKIISRKDFSNGLKSKFKIQQIDKALAQANNNEKKAKQLLKEGMLAFETQKIETLMTNKSKLNLVLQFFNHPQLQKIRTSLQGNRDKASKFFDWVVSDIKDKSSFKKKILKEFREYAVAFLCREYAITDGDLLDKIPLKKGLKVYEQQPMEQQNKVRSQILSQTNTKLVKALEKQSVNSELAIFSVRAAKNNIKDLRKHLLLGGINQQFDFYLPDPTKQQNILSNYFKDETIFSKLTNPKEIDLELLSLSALRPGIFQLIVRNKKFFDSKMQKIIKSNSRTK